MSDDFHFQFIHSEEFAISNTITTIIISRNFFAHSFLKQNI